MIMNWSSGLYETIEANPSKLALWTPKSGFFTFAALGELVRKTQRALQRLNVTAGDHILLLDKPGPQLYAVAIAAVSMGATILLVEPWLPVERINHIIRTTQPKVFWTPVLGRIWASRIAEIRSISHWIRPQSVGNEIDPRTFIREEVPGSHRAILSFSSGTSGIPKGIPRTHQYMEVVTDILSKFDSEPEGELKPTMAIFPNLVFYHLSRGRGTYLMPSRWPKKVLDEMGSLPKAIAPHTLVCGPAFLEKVIATKGFEHLDWIGVGGALLDCNILDSAIKRFPHANIELIYGSTEVEPVSHADGRQALAICRANQYFQVTYLGHAVPEITMDATAETLWVTGPHVTEEYVQASNVDHALKRRDEAGRIWHNMGDRIAVKDDGLWHCGRSFQRPEDFADEQRIYWLIQSSACFIGRTSRNEPFLIGEHVLRHSALIRREFPHLKGIYEAAIVRDIRHRSRIDRKLSLKPLLKTIEKF